MTKKEFKTHVLPTKATLYRLALGMLHSRQEAEDVIQDVYLKLWNMRGELLEYNSIEALAVTVTRNLCVDRLRSYRNRKKNDGGLENILLSSNDRHDPVHSLEMNESMQCIRACIEDLPKQQRMLIQLRDIELYSYEEIADMTGLKVNNIRVALSRARKSVREEYERIQNYGETEN